MQQRLFAQLPASNLGAVVDAANRVLVRSTRHDERSGKPAVEAVVQVIDALRQDARHAGERVEPRDYPVARVLRTRLPLSPHTDGIVGADAATAHTWVLVTGYPQLDGTGRLLHAVVAFVDISAQHEAEQLRLARESAEAASQAQSDFLSRLSHELRTPLNAIIGFTQLVQMDPELQADRREQLGHVLGAGEHLLVLINQILDISSIESGQQKVATQAVPLAPLLETCVAICRPLAQARAVALAVAGPLPGEPGLGFGGSGRLSPAGRGAGREPLGGLVYPARGAGRGGRFRAGAHSSPTTTPRTG